MKYEQFDPTANCNPVLPLNSITNRMSFYQINLFDLKIEVEQYKEDGSVINKNEIGKAKYYRLGLPLALLFPELKDSNYLKEYKSKEIEPFCLGIENIYLPTSAPEKKAKEPTLILVYIEDLITKRVTLNKGDFIELDLSQVNLIRRNGEIIIRKEEEYYLLRFAGKRSIAADKTDAKTGTIHTKLGEHKISEGEFKNLILKGTIPIRYETTNINIELKADSFQMIGIRLISQVNNY
ncbi:MAG: hypothetical protein IPO83_03890 [Chitinophagaceae bacterium]|nr:hypothetical protein [Chitinophagaceae bacterium]